MVFNKQNKIPVLFCEINSVYKKLKCDTYDINRNALTWAGGCPAIYHPPCRLWSRLRKLSTADVNEKYLAVWSVRMVRLFKGVLEHPAGSSLWSCCNLPKPGEIDEFGGYTIEVDQYHFGHLARKRTWLYIVGLPFNSRALYYRKIPGKPKYALDPKTSGTKDLPERYRSYTPKLFAKYIVKIIIQINNSKS